MMIGNYPVTWLVTELLSVVAFVMCMFHALKQDNYKIKLFELLMFIIGCLNEKLNPDMRYRP